MKLKAERVEGSLLAGVCAGIAQAFQWNVWVLRILFVAFLLTKVSGVPMLEKAADERWGGQDDYEAYKRSTPVLVLKPPA